MTHITPHPARYKRLTGRFTCEILLANARSAVAEDEVGT
jgi:hypothetical protein